MHGQLLNNAMRDNIFNETADENGCKHEDVRKILKLLQDKDSSRRTSHGPLTELEWKK